MENYEHKEDEPEEEYVDIYSKRAVLGFSAFFNVIFGGALLMFNLRAAGYKKEAGQVILFSILYHILSLFIISATGIKVSAAAIKLGAAGGQISPADIKSIFSLFALTLVINTIGGLILTRYFFKKYFPDNDYYPKPILQALMICLLISVVSSLILSNL
jgi:hypothetical protein